MCQASTQTAQRSPTNFASARKGPDTSARSRCTAQRRAGDISRSGSAGSPEQGGTTIESDVCVVLRIVHTITMGSFTFAKYQEQEVGLAISWDLYNLPMKHGGDKCANELPRMRRVVPMLRDLCPAAGLSKIHPCCRPRCSLRWCTGGMKLASGRLMPR